MHEAENVEKTRLPTPEQVREVVSTAQTLSELEDALDTLARIEFDGFPGKEIISADDVIYKVRQVFRGEKSVKILTKFGLEEKVQELLSAYQQQRAELMKEKDKEVEQKESGTNPESTPSPEEDLAKIFKNCESQADAFLRYGFSGIERVVRDREEQRLAPLFMDGMAARLRTVSGVISDGWIKKNPVDVARGLRALSNSLREPPQRFQPKREDVDSLRTSLHRLRDLHKHLNELEVKLKQSQAFQGIDTVVQELRTAQLACEQKFNEIAGYARRWEDYLRR
jgi:hypothetical protein